MKTEQTTIVYAHWRRWSSYDAIKLLLNNEKRDA